MTSTLTPLSVSFRHSLQVRPYRLPARYQRSTPISPHALNFEAKHLSLQYAAPHDHRNARRTPRRPLFHASIGRTVFPRRHLIWKKLRKRTERKNFSSRKTHSYLTRPHSLNPSASEGFLRNTDSLLRSVSPCGSRFSTEELQRVWSSEAGTAGSRIMLVLVLGKNQIGNFFEVANGQCGQILATVPELKTSGSFSLHGFFFPTLVARCGKSFSVDKRHGWCLVAHFLLSG